YEVEEIKDLRKFGSQWKYLVKWQGWPESQNTWEPEGNLTNCKRLVQSYHRQHPDKRSLGSQGTRKNQARKDRENRQPVTSRNQRTVRISMVQQQRGSYSGRRSPQPALSHDPGSLRQQGHDDQERVPDSSSREVHDEDETPRRRREPGVLPPVRPPT